MPSGARTSTAASGTLNGVPLAHALIYIRNKRLSGVLELRATTERHACLVFWRGLVVSSMTTPTVARFGTVVYEMGLIDGHTLDSTTMASAKEKRPHVDILLERGAITEKQRDDVLAEQTRRRVHHLFTLPPATTFTFREGSPSTSEPPLAVDVLAPVWRGLCDFPLDDRATEVLARIGTLPIKLISEAVIERAELEPAERALCEALAAKPMPLDELRSTAKGVTKRRVDLLVYLLVITRSVEIGSEPAGLPSGAMWAAVKASQSSAAHIATAKHDSGETESVRTSSERLTAAATPRGPLDLGIEGIRRRAAGLSTETPFTTLGLNEGASAEAARAAYFRLGRLWHPDRITPELDEVRAEVERIFAHMTDAHALLTNPEARPAVVTRNGR